MSSYTISTAAEFAALMGGSYGYGLAGDYLDVTIASDIDLNDLGTPYNLPNPGAQAWYIHLNGQGHTISNLYHFGNADFYFFATFTGDIKDITFKDVSITAPSIYLFEINNATSGNYMENIKFSGNLFATGNTVIVYRCFSSTSQTNNISRCSYSGSIEADNIARVFAGNSGSSQTFTIMGCNAVLDHIYAQTMQIFDTKAVCCFAIINNLRGNTRTIFSRGSMYSYSVVKAANGAVAYNNTGVSMLYDSDVAEAGGVTFSGGTGERTTNLHDPTYMATVWGYPS